MSKTVSAAHTSIVQPEASRVWLKLTEVTASNTSARADVRNCEVVVGDFSARIKDAETKPERLSAYVGWRISVPIPEGKKGYVGYHFVSSNGGWVEIESDQIWSDDDIVRWLTGNLDDWVRSNGSVAPTDPDFEYP
ncbi:MAG TPA: hypothetical protein VLC46_16330 [Thermoanaerobaculia bacterium]|nr:hypothetical protein [Thermoanaerobaculia bacterium]